MNRRTLIAYAAVACVLALTAAPASAQTSWDAGTDDWFDPTKWTNGVPTSTTDTIVNNGGTAQANAVGAVTQDLTIGLSSGVGNNDSGTVQVNGFDLSIGRDLFVGRIFGTGNGNILGTLTTSNTLTVGQDLSVGLLDGGAPGSVATGVVTTGGPLNMLGGDVNVGVSNAPGNAIGVVTTGGPFNMSGVFVNIGVSTEFGNNANGSVIDLSGTGLLTAGAVSVGEANEGIGDGTGLLEVGSLNVTGTLKIGFMESNGGNADGTVNATGAVAVDRLRVGHAATFAPNLGIRTGMGQLTADGGLTVGDRLNVGLIDGDTKNHVVATGIVTAAGVNSSGVMHSVNIGSSFGIGDANGTVIDTSGTGELDVLFDVDVGVHSNVAGIATGLLEIGSLSIGERLRIGVADKDGNADGTVEAFGTVSAKEVKVGVSELDSTGAATGQLTVGDGLTAMFGVDIGVSNGAGNAHGTVIATSGTGLLTAGAVSVGEANEGIGDGTGLLEVGSLNVTGTLKIGFMESNGGNADGTVNATGAVAVDRLRVGHAATFAPNLGIRTGMGQLTADGGLTVGDRLNVGLIDGDTKNHVVATGIVTAAGVNSSGVMHSVNIGSSFGIGDANGTVIDTSGTGELDVLFDVDVGVHSNVAGIATGLLEIGSLSIGERLRIGVADKDGNADGTVEAFGTVSAKEVKVGVSELDSTGAATGRLILHDDMVATSMIVGRNLSGSGGTAIGEVTLDNAILFLDDLMLGEGSDVTFNIDGLLRGDEYGAINALTAMLLGLPGESMGQALFNFLPSAGTHHFDLIIAPILAAGSSGINGTFSDFDVLGLDAGFTWSTAYVTEFNFDFFRLTIASTVPEPDTVVLVLMGLGVLGMARRRRAA